MNPAIKVDRTLPSRWTGIAILSLIATTLFAAIVFLGIEVSLCTQAADTYIRLNSHDYSQLQRELLRLQVLIAGDIFDAEALDEQRVQVAGHIESLNFAASQGELPESTQALVDRIEVLWASTQESFDSWIGDPTNEAAQAALSQLLNDTELLANDMSSQLALQIADQLNQIKQSGEQLIAGLGLISVLFVAFVGLVILNLVRFIRERQGADSKLRLARHELEQRVQERAEALAEERNLLRTVMDTLPALVYVKDTESRILLVNQAIMNERRGAFSPDSVIGKTDFDFHPPDVAGKFYADEQEIIRTGNALMNHEEINTNREGQSSWYSTTKVPLRNSQGKIIGIVGVSHDITERKQIEQELAKERNLLRTVLDNVPDSIFINDTAGRLVLDNLASRRRFPGEASAESVLGKTVYDFFPAELAERYLTQDQSILQTGEPLVNDEQMNLDQDGNKHWFLINKVPLRDSEGKVGGIVGIARDITERKQAEEALAKEHNLLRTVIDNLPDPVFIKDMQGRNILNNQADARFAGVNSTQELIGKTVYDFFPPEIAAQFDAVERAILDTGQPQINQEEEHIDADGKKRWFLTTKTPLRDAQGEIFGLVGIVRDITERKRIEDELAKERNLLRTVIDNVPDLIFAKDRDSRFILANRACAHFVGAASSHELIGKMDFDVEATEAVARYHDEEQGLMRSGVPIINKEEFVVVARTGNSMWVSATKVPLRDQEGKVIGLVAVSRNITERKQIEEALAKERNLLRMVIDTLPDLVYVKDTESRFLLVNNTVLKDSNLTMPEEMVGKDDFDLQPPEIARKYIEDDRELFRSGQSIVNVVEPSLDRQGNDRWLSTTKLPLRNSRGTIIGLVGVSRDITQRKRIEDELAQERNLLRTLIDALPDYVYVKDTAGRFMLRNVSSVERLGVSGLDEVIGKTDFDFFPRELAEKLHAEEQAIILSGQPVINQELLLTEPDGRRRWLQYTKVPLRDNQEQIIGIVGVSRDINERKQAEEQLRILSNAVEQSPTSIVISDTLGTIQYVNPKFCELTGYSAEEAIKTSPRLVQSGKTPPETYEQLWNTILQGGEWRGELLNRRKNGEAYWVLSSMSPIKNPDGVITHFLAIQEDITERKQAEQALIRAHDQLEYERAQLEVILDSMGEGVIYDEKHQTRYINQALTRLTGYTIDEWRGALHPLKSEEVTEEEFEAFNQTIFESVENEGIWRGETRLQRKDGSEFDAGLTCTAVTGPVGQVIGAVTIIRDISQEKALQEQKSRFVANASHELRTPIANLKTRLYLMRKQPEKTDYHLEVMDEVTARMQRLVEDMLDVSRFERGLIPLQQQAVLVQDLISGVVKVQLAEAERKHIKLISEFPAEPLHIFADPERIIQVITNLVVNAINYTPEGGQVFVRVSGENGDAIIEVQDTGMGIAADQAHQIFQPFFRASQGISGGTGLGLTIAKEIVELHGGEIGLESDTGQGACFRVKLALLTK